MVMVVTPVETKVPAAGDCVMLSAETAVQLSVALTLAVKSGTAAWHVALALADLAGAQLTITGAVLSGTVPTVAVVIFEQPF